MFTYIEARPLILIIRAVARLIDMLAALQARTRFTSGSKPLEINVLI